MFYKEKGFYISLAAGIVAVVAFAAICINVLDADNGNNKPEEGGYLAEATFTPEPPLEEVVTPTPVSEEVTKMKPEGSAEPEKTETPATSKPKKTVQANTNNQTSLHFNQENGLLWPVSGKVLMEYSPDNVVYSKTLQQYRTNPGIVIGSKVGTSVKASANGVVTKVGTDDEMGRYVKMSIGDKFTVLYGQLKDITVQKGSSVKEGQVIGKVAKPSKYYSVEGANVYYKVENDGSTVNPMVLLR